MPTIHLTQKLQKEIGLKPVDLARVEESDTPFAEWYAHVFLINRKKQVIFVERQTMFSLTLSNVSRKDLRERLPELFEKGLGKALFVEGASGDVVKALLDLSRGDIAFAATRDRQMIASTTELIKHYKWSCEGGYSFQEADQRNRRLPVRGFPDKTNRFKYAIDVFAEALRKEIGLEFAPRKEDPFQNVPSDPGSFTAPGPTAYVFEARMTQYPEDEDIARRVAVSGKKSLLHLAQVVLNAFDFDCDHCFGFYGDIHQRPGPEQSEIYEAFVDAGVEPSSELAGSVERTKIGTVFKEVGKTMLFMFDYGHDWRFILELKNIEQNTAKKLPSVLERVGAAPPQYPPDS